MILKQLSSMCAAWIMSSSVYQWSWVGVTKIIFCSKLSQLPSEGNSSSLMKQRSEKKDKNIAQIKDYFLEALKISE